AEGRLYPVYTLVDGTPLNQTPPAELSQTAQTVGLYDYRSNGHYISDGCNVTALGKDSNGDLVFSIAAGVGNINGFMREREHALRLIVPEEWDTFQIDGEQHNYDVEPNQNLTIRLRHGPLDSINLILVEKEITETVVRGLSINGSDPLQNDSVREIVEIKQSSTTYTPDVDYQLVNGRPDWSLGGSEPAGGSSYSVRYRYLDAVPAVSQSLQEVTVTGGRNGGEVVLNYLRRLPRIDLICLNEAGNAVYVKGESAAQPSPPETPTNLLKLATVFNDFESVPRVLNDGTRNRTYDDLSKLYYRLRQALDVVALNRLRIDIHEKEPAAKKGFFVDPFVDDRWRDAGMQQNAATRNGVLTLPLAVTIHNLDVPQVEMLPYEIEQVIEQSVRSTCKLINRFANHEPFPAQMMLEPATDFWTDVQETWDSEVTHRVFGPQVANTQEQQVVGEAEDNAEFLRAVDVTVKIEGFGDGELLDRILFDNVEMTPIPKPSADNAGKLTLILNIPAGQHAAGEKGVEAYGVGGSEAFASFVGEGKITTRVMQKVTTLVIVPPPPPPPQIITVVRVETRNRDPRGQTFALPRGNRHAVSATLWFCKIGDPNVPVVVELRATNDAGYPTSEILAQAKVDMSSVSLDLPTTCLFPGLPYLLATREYALIVITPDTEHSISAAVLGGFDEHNQSFLGANPYSVGTEIESSNNSTWTAVHGSDLTFGIGVAKFTATTRRVELGDLDLDHCSDLMIAAATDIPEDGCSVLFEITRANGSKIRLAAYVSHQFDDWITEKVSVAAILKGTETASPRLFPGVQVRAGQLAQTADYVGRTFQTDNAVRFPVRIKRDLPNGAEVSIFLKNASGNFVEAPFTSGEVLDEAGTVDATHELSQNLGDETAVKIRITGNPKARPILSDLRAVATV
ncbi:DUF4815 domain-containing protein, partial [Pseudovibrio ascidiaceicola]|uniref:DUF4815 domain-containing protein n=1 Tax=Pseudovibrio ascidiaceicola TaxID=285279 RepID=UPI003D35E218